MSHYNGEVTKLTYSREADIVNMEMTVLGHAPFKHPIFPFQDGSVVCQIDHYIQFREIFSLKDQRVYLVQRFNGYKAPV
jgi:hypothetical protein